MRRPAPSSCSRLSRIGLAGLALALACAPADERDEGDDDGGGKADDLDPSTFACKNVDGITLDALAQVDDPIATFLVKRGEGCPADYGAMLEKLRAVDPQGCEAGRDLVTRIVSDDARLEANANNFRTVTTRACGSRPNHSLFWTLLGVSAGENVARRTFVEMAALDANTGRYNFWVFHGGSFSFKGDSIQAAAGEIACGGCHRGGEVLMKELDDPWIHWESDGNPLPGVDALFTAHAPMFGQRGNGKELEALVRAGNDVVVEARIGHHGNPATGSVSALLKPLFCTEVVNLDTAGRTVDGPVETLPADALVDPRFGVERSITVDPAAYEAAIVAAGQTVQGVTGRTDTEFKLVFPERGGMDDAYVQALIARGIVDEDFVLDVLSVDFTRPVFSDARCKLLGFAPAYGAPGMATSGDEGGTDEDSSTDDDAGTEGGSEGDTGDEDLGTCCEATTTATKGCSNATVQECVCAKDAFCCESQWDQTCVGEVDSFMCGTCPAPVVPDPMPPTAGTTIAEATPASIRAAFIAAIEQSQPAAGSAAAELLAKLQAQGDSASHRERVDAYLAACETRPARDLLDDVVRHTHLVRQLLRTTTSLIEHPEQMPTITASVPASAHLDPATCTLVE
jgi:hypothetical protein